MWRALEEIGERKNQTINEICSSIARQRPESTLTAAVRVFIMAYFRDTARAYGNSELADANIPLTAERRFAADIVQKSFIESGDDFDEKIRWTLDAIPKIEKDGLDSILFHWMYLHLSQRRIPGLDDIDQSLLNLDAVIGKVNIIDVSSESPRNFIVVRSSNIANEFWGLNMSNKPVAEYPFMLHAMGMQIDFDAAKATKLPTYHTIRQKMGDARRHYARVILPLSRNGHVVDRLLSIARPIHAPQIVH